MVLVLIACVHPAPPAAAPPRDVPALDEPALTTLLANTTGAPLVVNFWATWCRPCVAEMALLDATARAHPGVRFVLVSVDEVRDAAYVRSFVAEHALALPVYHLAVPEPGAVLGRTVPEWPDLIPVTLVLEPGGAVRARFDGLLDAEELGHALR